MNRCRRAKRKGQCSARNGIHFDLDGFLARPADALGDMHVAACVSGGRARKPSYVQHILIVQPNGTAFALGVHAEVRLVSHGEKRCDRNSGGFQETTMIRATRVSACCTLTHVTMAGYLNATRRRTIKSTDATKSEVVLKERSAILLRIDQRRLRCLDGVKSTIADLKEGSRFIVYTRRQHMMAASARLRNPRKLRTVATSSDKMKSRSRASSRTRPMR